MSMRRLGLIIALSGTSLYACGDDAPSDDKPITVPVPDAGGMDAGPAGPTGAARPDAASPGDAGAVVVADTGVADAAVRDSGATVTPPATDSGAARTDSGVAVVDSGTAGGSDGIVPASGDPRSAACLSCETEQCKASKWPESEQVFKACSDFGTEAAKDGMGVGKTRTALCESLQTCVRKTSCAAPRAPLADGSVPTPEYWGCLCGDLPINECFLVQKVSDFKGPCRDQIADAAETANAMTLIERMVNPEFAVGAAITRTQCGLRLCGDECYAPCKGKADGALCAGQEPLPPESAMPNSKQGMCQAQSCQDVLVPFYQSM